MRLMGQPPEAFDGYWEQIEAWIPAVRETLPTTSSYHAKMEELINSFAHERGHE